MTNLNKTPIFDINATDDIEIENTFTSSTNTSALAYGSDDADAAHYSKTKKKTRWNKSFAFVTIATVAVAFGWFALKT